MRYGATPTNAPEWLAMKLGIAPLPILDTLLAPIQARALMAAEEAGIFRRLAEGPARNAELARASGVDPECLRLVLRVVRAMGYVELRSGTWSLTHAGRRFFGPKAVEPYEAFVQYGPAQWKMIERLEEVLKSGQGIDFHDSHTAEEWKIYQAAMFENARAFAWFVVDNVPVKAGAKRCIDIAGSHGWVGAALAKKHVGLRSTVLDRREALPTARTIAREHGYADTVAFEEGDLRSGSFGDAIDVALLCNILHHFPAEQNREILKRLRGSMTKGATAAIFEIETPREDAAPDAAGDAFALYFRITSTSTCFRADDYIAWLGEAGFANARAVRSVRMPSRVLVVAEA